MAEQEVAAPLWPADALRRALDTSARRLLDGGQLRAGFLDWWDPRVAGGNRPRPFVLSVEAGPGLSLSEPLRGELRVMGAGQRLGEVLAVLGAAVESGLAGTRRVRLRLQALRVTGAPGPVWTGEGQLPRAASLADVALPRPGAPVRVSFVSPLQLDKVPVPPTGVTAAALFHRALTRLHALGRLTGARDSHRWEPPGLVTEHRQLAPVRVRLPGAAGHGHAPLFGLVGEFAAEGETGDLGALMAAAGVLGLGRGTVMGLGRVRG